MAEYYLIAQLPSLDGINGDSPLPITEEQFSELCGRFLGKKVLIETESLTLLPPMDVESSNVPLIDAWNTRERDLRLALGKVRAEKLEKVFDLRGKNVPSELLKAANTAVDTESPMDAELFLLKNRLGFLETLRPTDIFSKDYIYYYGLKLKLLERIKRFDAELGKAAYRSIYNSITQNGGDTLEAEK
ncbi:MAG: hypothetical protein E7660_06250 [Ruminococcaceae bacterium]|nr:hypothetical protein [Oscillospiraceae bacterium]